MVADAGLPGPVVAKAGLPWIAQAPGGSRVAPVGPAVRHERASTQAARGLHWEIDEGKGDGGGGPATSGELGADGGGDGGGGDGGGGGGAGGGAASCPSANAIRRPGQWMAGGGLVALFVGTFGALATYPGNIAPVNDTDALNKYNDQLRTSETFAITGIAGAAMFCAGLAWAMACPLPCCR
jgi:hypothetical protein